MGQPCGGRRNAVCDTCCCLVCAGMLLMAGAAQHSALQPHVAVDPDNAYGGHGVTCVKQQAVLPPALLLGQSVFFQLLMGNFERLDCTQARLQ